MSLDCGALKKDKYGAHHDFLIREGIWEKGAFPVDGGNNDYEILA
jgi:hypothetical protein